MTRAFYVPRRQEAILRLIATYSLVVDRPRDSAHEQGRSSGPLQSSAPVVDAAYRAGSYYELQRAVDRFMHFQHKGRPWGRSICAHVKMAMCDCGECRKRMRAGKVLAGVKWLDKHPDGMRGEVRVPLLWHPDLRKRRKAA